VKKLDQEYLFQQDFTIRSSEVTPDGKASLHSICNLLQEVAGNHAGALNLDITQLMEKNLTWVLQRLNIKINRYPTRGETITIKTWPSSGDKLRAYRDFLILDDDTNEIGCCLSYWLMLNTQNRRPVRMPEEVLNMAPRDISHVIGIKKNRLSSFENPDYIKKFKARRSDLDLNNHVNNVRYIEWALEVLPAEVNVYEMDIEFRAECREGDKIISELKSVEGSRYLHQLKNRKEKKAVAVAITIPGQ